MFNIKFISLTKNNPNLQNGDSAGYVISLTYDLYGNGKAGDNVKTYYTFQLRSFISNFISLAKFENIRPITRYLCNTHDTKKCFQKIDI